MSSFTYTKFRAKISSKIKGLSNREYLIKCQIKRQNDKHLNTKALPSSPIQCYFCFILRIHQILKFWHLIGLLTSQQFMTILPFLHTLIVSEFLL